MATGVAMRACRPGPRCIDRGDALHISGILIEARDVVTWPGDFGATEVLVEATTTIPYLTFDSVPRLSTLQEEAQRLALFPLPVRTLCTATATRRAALPIWG